MRRVQKSDGSFTVIKDGRIVTNVGGAGAAPPTAGRVRPSDENETGMVTEVDYDGLADRFDGLRGSASMSEVAEAQRDFEAWVGRAAFADEGDTSSGQYWEGATRFATTPEGAAALRTIIDNPNAPERLRYAAERLQLEAKYHHDAIQQEWVADRETTGGIAPDAKVIEAHRLDGTVTVRGRSHIEGCDITDVSVIDSSTVIGSTVTGSRVSGGSNIGVHSARPEWEQHQMPLAAMWESRYRDMSGDERRERFAGLRLREAACHVTDSTVEGSDAVGADIVGSTVTNSTVTGTGTVQGQFAPASEVTGFYRGNGSASRHFRGTGEKAERRTRARISASTVTDATVRNASVTNSTVSGGASVENADVSNVDMSGSAAVHGVYRHRKESVNLQVMDMWSRVENVTLSREYIGPDADVRSQKDVESRSVDGVVYTRYRGSRAGLTRPWLYTSSRIDPMSGDVKRKILGSGDAVGSAVRRLF